MEDQLLFTFLVISVLCGAMIVMMSIFARTPRTTAFFSGLTMADTVVLAVQFSEQMGAFTIVIALALLYFFWGLARFILNAGDEDAQKAGKSIMLWGIIAFFVMVSVWGIVNFIGNAFNFDETTPELPNTPR